jgi:hypothetical protein
VRTLRSALPLLRRPPAPAAVRFKPLSDLGELCQLAAYTDVRFVIDLLNAVCAGHWHAAYDPLPAELRGTPRGPDDPAMLYVRCTLSVFGVERTDVGEGRDGTGFGAGPKAAHSDALKRAAVHFGINQALYAMRTVWLPVMPGAMASCPATHVARTGSGHLRVPDQTTERLRELYRRWLQEGSGRSFGSPIDLGEDLGAVGLEPQGEAEGEGAGTPAPTDAPAPPASRPDSNGAPAIGAARSETREPRPAPVVPGTPEQRTGVRQAAHQAGLDDEQLGVLAQLLCGERILDRVGAVGLAELHHALEVVVGAGVPPTAFARALAKAAVKPERDAAAAALRRWLTAQAERVDGPAAA